MTILTRHRTPSAAAAAAAVLALALLLLLQGPSPAHAGGFSVTTLDPLTEAPRAGATLAVGYTVRAHGMTPMPAPDSGIAVVTPEGRTTFPGRREGPAGHYVAQVELPAAGTWRWEVVQSGFTLQDLGSLTVLPAGATAPAPAAAARPDEPSGPGPLALALLGLTLATAGALAGRLLTLRRGPAAG